MLPMPSAAPLSRVLLVAEKPAPAAAASSARIRRYKLARLQLDAREARFAHLRHAHD